MQFAANSPSLFILRPHQACHVVGDSSFLCCFFLVMDVETSAYIPFECSIRRETRYSSIQYPTVLTGVMAHPVLRLKRLTRIEVANVDLQAAIEVFRMHVLRPAVAKLLVETAPHKIQPSFIEVI